MQKTISRLEAARRYLSMGLTPIPCHAPDKKQGCTCRLGNDCVSPGKHPAIPWQRYQRKPVDDDQLLIWFGPGGMFENQNIGIVTGTISTNVFIVDVDCGPGKFGEETLRDLQMQHDDLPPTMQAKTGGGGRHYFYRAPEGVRIVTDKNVLGPGVDVRGEGGFAVVAPSVHANGNLYGCDFDEIVEAPAWLLDLVTEGAQHNYTGQGLQAGTSSDHPFKATDGREGVMVRVILATICKHFEEQGALPTLDALVQEGFPVYVEKVKARSGNLEAEGRGITLFTHRAKYQLYRASRNELRVLQEVKAEKQEKPAGAVVAKEAAPPEVQSKELRILDWPVSRYQGQPPEIQWLIQGVIPQGVPMLLAAIGGLGKSFLSLDLALKVAGSGNEWDDQTQFALGGRVTGFGRVVFLTAEDSAAAIHRRLDAINKQELRARAAKNFFVVPLPDAGGAFPFIAQDSTGLHHTGGYMALREQLLQLAPISLVIFDPLQAFVHADVTADPAAAQFWWSTMSELCAATGATVLVSHHMRKEGAFSIRRPADARQAIRGTTALVDGARLVYGLWSLPENEETDVCRALDVEPGTNAVVCGAVVKTNEFADMEVRTFKRDESGLLMDCTAEIEDLMSQVNSLTPTQIGLIFAEVKNRFESGLPFNPNPKGRTHSFTFWMNQTYGIPKKVAETKLTEWINRNDLVVKRNSKSGAPGLFVGEAASSGHFRGVKHDD